MPRRKKSYNNSDDSERYYEEFTVLGVDGEWGELQCPRKDCEGTFIVERTRFKEGHHDAVRTPKCRPCPYCFRISRIPGRGGAPLAAPRS